MPQLFPPEMNRLPRLLLSAAVALVLFLTIGIYYAASPKSWRTGYTPEQPIAFSHKLHVAELGMSCTACHTSSAYAPNAGLPDARSCLACHKHILPDSPRLAPLHRAANPASSLYTGEALVWKRVNKLPDHAVFNHSAHVNRGVACTSCHGDITNAERVSVEEPLSMSWCLDCHRSPEKNLVPLEKVLEPSPQTPSKEKAGLAPQWKIKPPTDCTACHH